MMPIFVFALFGRTVKLASSIKERNSDQIKINIFFIGVIFLLGGLCVVVLETLRR